jgi:aspartyl-tRNA(Asn)/glutamyl-tRNA(Gln) amidotransferase subunit A
VREPAELTLREVAAAIRRRKLSSLELTRSLIARIERWQKLNAFVRIETEKALLAAKAADRALARRGPKGPLHGVPLAHKDMYYSSGKPAGCGSKLREGWIAPVTSTTIARLESTGSFRLGALHMAAGPVAFFFEGAPSLCVDSTASVAHQATGGGELAKLKDCGHRVADR